jgi:cold-inducible RNA-binding protein
MNSNLYVGNLEYSVRDNDLKELFGQYGTVVNASVIMDRFKKDFSRGYGFVEMSSDAEAEAAMKALDGADLKGRQLKVKEARQDQGAPAEGGAAAPAEMAAPVEEEPVE